MIPERRCRRFEALRTIHRSGNAESAYIFLHMGKYKWVYITEGFPRKDKK